MTSDELSRTPIDDTPMYIIVGSNGVHSREPALLETAYAVANAHAMAQKALAGNSTQWSATADAFESLQTMVPLPAGEHCDDLVVGKQLNIAAVYVHALQLANACKAAALYTEEDFENTPSTMQKMAQLSCDARPYNIVDHGSVVSNLAVVSCDAALEVAKTVIEDSKLEPADAAVQYQQSVAVGEQWYGLIHPSAISSALKESFSSVKKRVNDTYSATYPTILKATSIDIPSTKSSK